MTTAPYDLLRTGARTGSLSATLALAGLTATSCVVEDSGPAESDRLLEEDPYGQPDELLSPEAPPASPLEGEACTWDSHCPADAPACVDGQCRDGSEGDPCDYNSDCAAGNRCVQGTCWDGGVGDPCTYDSHCGASAPYCADGACSAGALGDFCLYNSDCSPAAAYCALGACSEGNAGDTCEIDIDCSPAAPLCVIGDVCSAGQVGDACGYDGDCSADAPLCSLGACSLGQAGDACDFDSDCSAAAAYCSDLTDQCTTGETGSPCSLNADCVENCNFTLQQCLGDGGGGGDGDGDGDPIIVGPCTPAPWASELVYQGNTYDQIDAAVDVTNRLHVVYRAPGIGTRWARRGGQSWLKETIPTANGCDGNPAVAVDPELGVHVTFEGKGGECDGGARLDYAYRPANGGWTIEGSELGSPGEYVAWVSVVLDDAGQVFSSYYHRDLVSPRVAIRDSNGVWSIETASALLGAGKANSIALDDNGGAHLVYRRELDKALYYAYRDPNSQSWAEELITAGGFLNDLGQSAKIEVDALGDVHIFSDASGGPRYLHRAAGPNVWDSEVVDNVPSLGRYATMDLDADGGIHVAYQRENTGTLHYGYRAPGAVDWTLEEIASGGKWARVVVAPSGMVHIVHVSGGTIERWYSCPAH